jgi:hypothetical protein
MQIRYAATIQDLLRILNIIIASRQTRKEQHHTKGGRIGVHGGCENGTKYHTPT